MNDELRHKLVWGWLRLFLAFVQLSFVPAAIGAAWAVGLKPITWIFAITATTATVMSLLIYRGKKDPGLIKKSNSSVPTPKPR